MVRFALLSVCVSFAWAAMCPDDPDLDMCHGGTPSAPSAPSVPTAGLSNETDFAMRQMSVPTMALVIAIANGLGGSVGGVVGPLLMSTLLVPVKAGAVGSGSSTCKDLKDKYKEANCCGADGKVEVDAHVVPFPKTKLDIGDNPCEGKKPKPGTGFDNKACATEAGFEQSGADVSKNEADRMTPEIAVTDYDAIKRPYWKGADNGNFSHGPLCPVNVHWHLGAEHRSKGQYDEYGKSPQVKGKTPAADAPTRRLRNSTESGAEARQLANDRYGFACHHYKNDNPAFTTPYAWKHCVDMEVGATYEVHWPHSVLGSCHTPWQYQTPFYDGVFCGITQKLVDTCVTNHDCLSNAVGVQGQVFTIINDDKYYYPNLIKGMINAGSMGQDVAYYTGSSTGTSRDNSMCSMYTPITWQVDRKCHLISASSFDKLCADMKQQYDDMSGDLHAHGARLLVAGAYTANNVKDGDAGR